MFFATKSTNIKPKKKQLKPNEKPIRFANIQNECGFIDLWEWRAAHHIVVHRHIFRLRFFSFLNRTDKCHTIKEMVTHLLLLLLWKRKKQTRDNTLDSR